MSEINKKRVLVTGASSGIGYYTAVEFARNNARVALFARRMEGLYKCRKEILKVKPSADILITVGDVIDTGSMDKSIDEINEKWGGIDILVNNAGVGLFGLCQNTDVDLVRKTMEVNFFGPIYLISKFLPQMIERKHGHIVNVSSYLGDKALPGCSGYSASKAAILRYGESLGFELIDSGVNITTVNPGTTDTEFVRAGIIAHGDRPVPMKGQDNPQSVAQHIVKAVKQNKKRVVLTTRAKAILTLNRLSVNLADYLICAIKKAQKSH